eukprot:7923061-Ditylum_brightwellii.AAC.1
MEAAIPEIKSAIQECLLFLLKYVVIKAFGEKANEHYAHVFNECANGNLTIDKDTLKKSLQKLGTGLGQEFLSSKFTTYDIDNDGHFSKEEFTNLCLAELGQRQEVATKFMRNKEQFNQEVGNRRDSRLNPEYVLSIDANYDATNDNNFKDDIKQYG